MNYTCPDFLNFFDELYGCYLSHFQIKLGFSYFQGKHNASGYIVVAINIIDHSIGINKN